jgi:murein DD-endopeptidase MepM/ murein hydrolase activator NlpD
MNCKSLTRRVTAFTLGFLFFLMPCKALAFPVGYIPDAPVKTGLAAEIQPLYLQQLTDLQARKQLEYEPLTAVEHRVQRGETLGSIAKQYGTTVTNLMELNNLQNPHFIREDRVLIVWFPQVEQQPEKSDLVHRLQRGETVWELARQYGVKVDLVLQTNGITDPQRLMPGDEIVIPAAATNTVTSVPAERELVVASRTSSRSSITFIWPATGRISSGFGPRWGRFHYGIDIAAKTGTPIYAVADGRVVVSGWRTGYGYMVRIDHSNGWESVYGHASKLYAQSGQHVTTGQRIAAVGQTGNSTGPHLHFELILQGKHMNPLKHLP